MLAANPTAVRPVTSRPNSETSPEASPEASPEPLPDPGELHVRLARLNAQRLCPAEPTEQWTADLTQAHALALLEGRFLEQERTTVAHRAAQAPRQPEAFAAWFDALRDDGPGQHDVLFDYLAEQATVDQMRWFLVQELATEAGFDDLVALTQLRMPTRVKLELARNYWDEMGRGKARAMHGPMLDALAQSLGVEPAPLAEVAWESLAVSNLLAGLAYNRRFAYHSLGALGAIELTAPSRAVKVVAALERLGIEKIAARYFRVHAVVDIGHARTWRDEALIPTVAANPQAAVHIAEGALMRLCAGARTFDRYRAHMGVLHPARPIA